MPPLVRAGSVVLDGSGNGSVQIGPVPTFTRWEIERLNVTTSGGAGTNQSQCRVYRGDAGNDARLEDSTYAGNLDAAEYPNPVKLMPGEYITVAWTVGRPGAIATVTVRGTTFDGVQ